jgi:hypothetical protein
MEITRFEGIGTSMATGHLNIARAKDVYINRTKEGIDPFTRIFKTPSYTDSHSRNLTGYGVEIEKPDGSLDLAGTVSKSYLLVSNEEISDVAHQILVKSGYEHRLRRQYFDGGRFAEIYDFLDHDTYEVTEGRRVQLSLIIRNSYNSIWPAEVSLMALDLFCENGLITGKHFETIRFKHTQGNVDWRDMVEQGMGVLQGSTLRLAAFAERLGRLANEPATEKELRQVFTKTQLAQLGPQNMGKLLQRFWTKESPTLYGLLAAGTNVFWHDTATFTAQNFTTNRLIVDGLLDYAATN